MSSKMKLPGPGLQGDYTGTCVACLQPTDTCLAFQGEPEWFVAGLVHMGVAAAVAIKMVATWPSRPDEFPDDVWPVRVCRECAERAGLPAPVLAIRGAGLPVVGQR